MFLPTTYITCLRWHVRYFDEYRFFQAFGERALQFLTDEQHMFHDEYWAPEVLLATSFSQVMAAHKVLVALGVYHEVKKW